MKPRCPGTKVNGHFTGFICVLDDGHAGFCQPYIAPTVDEWRAVRASETALGNAVGEWYVKAVNARHELRCALDRENAADADRARLQAELDALRAILASGCDDLRGLAGKVGA